MLRIGVLGATGYTGLEIVRILARHPFAEVGFLSSETYAGQAFSAVYPCDEDTVLVAPGDAPVGDMDLVFLCTPHGASALLAKRVLDAGVKCVDLSADFRLRDVEMYRAFYREHTAPGLLSDAVYGLTEFYRDRITGSHLVANPGCYPTGALLPLLPLVRAGLLSGERIIVDAKSGVSGAGAKPSIKTHFCSVHDNFAPYSIGHVHRHAPEIEQELVAWGARNGHIVFSPHLLPVSRGILSTIYLHLAAGVDLSDVHDCWSATYADEPFVRVLPQGTLASLAHVVNTNLCAISVASAGYPGGAILVSSIDNLLKGASGQAIQNMNVMFGLNETSGLV